MQGTKGRDREGVVLGRTKRSSPQEGGNRAQRKRERSEPEPWSETTRKYLSEDNKGSNTDYRKEGERRRKREGVRDGHGGREGGREVGR